MTDQRQLDAPRPWLDTPRPLWVVYRVPDPFGIPVDEPWTLLLLRPCIVPTCEGACYRVVKTFDTGVEAEAFLTAQRAESTSWE